MNISSDISSSNNILNSTNMENDIKIFSLLYVIGALLSFYTNSYVIWLIVTGTGNGLAAEFFSLNFSVCEIFLCIEFVLFFIFLNYGFQILWIIVLFLNGLGITGRPLFECLICVERYLAVVHPVIFLKFKPVRYRLMCSAVVWVASFCSGGFITPTIMSSIDWLYFIFWLAQIFIFLSMQLFCCVSVLRALKKSGPGERGREREREEENHMKRRAFYLILITTVSMFIMYAPYIIVTALYRSFMQNTKILMHIGYVYFALAGLVQPLLFLYRVGKLNIKCQ